MMTETLRREATPAMADDPLAARPGGFINADVAEHQRPFYDLFKALCGDSLLLQLWLVAKLSPHMVDIKEKLQRGSAFNIDDIRSSVLLPLGLSPAVAGRTADLSGKAADGRIVKVLPPFCLQGDAEVAHRLEMVLLELLQDSPVRVLDKLLPGLSAAAILKGKAGMPFLALRELTRFLNDECGAAPSFTVGDLLHHAAKISQLVLRRRPLALPNLLAPFATALPADLRGNLQTGLPTMQKVVVPKELPGRMRHSAPMPHHATTGFGYSKPNPDPHKIRGRLANPEIEPLHWLFQQVNKEKQVSRLGFARLIWPDRASNPDFALRLHAYLSKQQGGTKHLKSTLALLAGEAEWNSLRIAATLAFLQVAPAEAVKVMQLREAGDTEAALPRRATVGTDDAVPPRFSPLPLLENYLVNGDSLHGLTPGEWRQQIMGLGVRPFFLPGMNYDDVFMRVHGHVPDIQRPGELLNTFAGHRIFRANLLQVLAQILKISLTDIFGKATLELPDDVRAEIESYERGDTPLA